MKLVEIFDKAVKHKVIDNDKFVYETEAVIGGRTIVFRAEKNTRKVTDKAIWEIEFSEDTEHTSNYRASGKGNELEVFSFVKASIDDMIKLKNPDVIEFGAASNRETLYKKLAQRYAANFAISTQKRSNGSIFTLTKNETN